MLRVFCVTTHASTAEDVFQLRNGSLYASPDNEVTDANFEDDSAVMIEYCEIWLDNTIIQIQMMAERNGTRAFLK
jgi:hypothetical protein